MGVHMQNQSLSSLCMLTCVRHVHASQYPKDFQGFTEQKTTWAKVHAARQRWTGEQNFPCDFHGRNKTPIMKLSS